MFAFAQFPSKHTAHLHTITVFHIFHANTKLIPHNMAHLNETPYLIQRGYIFRLKAIDTIIQRIGPSQQIPRRIDLTIACCPLQHKTLLIQSLESSHRPEKGISPEMLQRIHHLVYLLLHHGRDILDGFNLLLQRLILLCNLTKRIFQKAVLLSIIRLYLLFHPI